MSKDSIIRKKPLFPVMYGIVVEKVMLELDNVAEKGFKINKVDVLRLRSKISNLEQFVKPLVNRSSEYESDKAILLKDFDSQTSTFDQVDMLRRWFGIINTVVDQMYFDIGTIDRYETNNNPYSVQS